MAATWLSVRVELIGGRGQRFWPRPGRLFAAARSHSFAALASAIDGAFARWDRAHLHAFTFSDGGRIGGPFELWDEVGDMRDSSETKLSMLQTGSLFSYVFDLGDDWTHLCSVALKKIDPLEVLGVTPQLPTPYFGWGDVPAGRGSLCTPSHLHRIDLVAERWVRPSLDHRAAGWAR